MQEYASHLSDPAVQGLQARLEPYMHLEKDAYPPEASALLDASAAHVQALLVAAGHRFATRSTAGESAGLAGDAPSRRRRPHSATRRRPCPCR